MRSNEITTRPTFLMVIGGAGSGKNYFISRNSLYSTYKLIDVDVLKANMPLNDAILAVKPALIAAFEAKEDVAHPTTGANLKAAQNKIKLAKQYGYKVILVFIDTHPDQAAKQVDKRVAQGGHDVKPEKIQQSNVVARANYDQLAPLADVSLVK